MKLLSGSELAGFVKERHARQVRALAKKPRLAIIQTKDDPIINTYVRLKKQYGSDVGVGVDVYAIKQTGVDELLDKLNSDDSVNGIIVQLPLNNPGETEEIVNLVAPQKDVDALGQDAEFEPATPMAIMWLLSGYNIELRGKNILLVGRGKLVGAPLEKILRLSELEVSVAEKGDNLVELTKDADIIITATSQPGLIKPEMIKEGAVVVDAGVTGEGGKTVGDVDPRVYERDDITITPQKGGVGPLTVCALFENLIRAAEAK